MPKPADNKKEALAFLLSEFAVPLSYQHRFPTGQRPQDDATCHHQTAADAAQLFRRQLPEQAQHLLPCPGSEQGPNPSKSSSNPSPINMDVSITSPIPVPLPVCGRQTKGPESSGPWVISTHVYCLLPCGDLR